TTAAALKAYPVYSFVRVRNDQLLAIGHRGGNGSNLLVHRTRLAGPRDRFVTTPNNDTLYSSAFLDLASGPVELTLPQDSGRYQTVAIMDARTDNVFIVRSDADGERIAIEFGNGETGRLPPTPDRPIARYRLPTTEAWLLGRTLVDGPADLDAARAAQRGLVLTVAQTSARRQRDAVVLPVLPDPAMLLRRANPVIAENLHLQDKALAPTGYGGNAEAFDTLPMWRQWIWRLLLPMLFERMKAGIAEGAILTGDGWSRTPPGIGTADASDGVRAAVALGGLGALPEQEAVYWMAVLDADGAGLDGGQRYRLTIPADVPADAFWSLSLYERLPDGRLFFVANPLQRFTIGNRTQGLTRNPDGSLTLLIQAIEPEGEANWLPAPQSGPFALAFRAYRPGEPILSGSWRLPAVARVP
ncbi:MAG: DUF1254 domain-containing protein, partial [Sandaracinobacteroides sp.]